MTKYQGLFLFDFAEEPVGNWEEEVGWRGMRDVWHLKDNPDVKLNIDPWEDICSVHKDGECTCQEVWVSNDLSGNWTTIGVFENYEVAKKEANEYMKTHWRGF